MKELKTKGDIISFLGIYMALLYLIAQMIRAVFIWL